MTTRITIQYDEYLNYEIRIERYKWLMWHMVEQHRRSSKFGACRLAHGLSRGRINIIDKAK